MEVGQIWLVGIGTYLSIGLVLAFVVAYVLIVDLSEPKDRTEGYATIATIILFFIAILLFWIFIIPAAYIYTRIQK